MVKEIAEAIVADKGPILLVITAVMTLIEITPIQFNPWSALFNWFGRQINKDIITKIDNIEKRLSDHIKDSEAMELRERRTNILDFSSSVIRGTNYHKEKFEFMINECDTYEEYCTANQIKNGVAEASIAEIRRIYKEHLRNNDFLSESVGPLQASPRKLAARKKDEGENA